MTAKFTILRDTREHDGEGWFFEPGEVCAGTEVATLATGDYSIKGVPPAEGVCIERKKSVSEFIKNLHAEAPRFERELARMAAFKRAYVVLEFTAADLIGWPQSRFASNPARCNEIRIKGPFALKLLLAMEARHPHVRFVFAGEHGKRIALAVVKQAWADRRG